MVFGIIKEVKLMKSIKKNVNNEIIINKSKFITKLIRIKSNDDAKNKLNMLKKEYADSTHICYGYIIEEYKKASDNGEPSGTAGKPILSALEHNDLNYILGAVIRYYGGVKLGTGGLVKAYSSSIMEALSNSQIVDLIDGYKVKIVINYDKIKTMDSLLNDVEVTYKEFDENITYEINIEIDNTNIELIKNNSLSFEILDKIKIAK